MESYIYEGTPPELEYEIGGGFDSYEDNHLNLEDEVGKLLMAKKTGGGDDKADKHADDNTNDDINKLFGVGMKSKENNFNIFDAVE